MTSTANAAAASSTSGKPAGTSFLEVLASALPTAVSGAAGKELVAQQRSQGRQAHGTANKDEETPIQLSTGVAAQELPVPVTAPSQTMTGSGEQNQQPSGEGAAKTDAISDGCAIRQTARAGQAAAGSGQTDKDVEQQGSETAQSDATSEALAQAQDAAADILQSGAASAAMAAMAEVGAFASAANPDGVAPAAAASVAKPVATKLQQNSTGDAVSTSSSNADAGAATRSGNSAVTQSGQKGAQSNGQSSQNASTDATQAAVTMARGTDSSSTQVSTSASHVAAQSSTQHAPADSKAEAGSVLNDTANSRTAEASADDQTVTQSINTARLLQSMNESEMRVGMRSSEFGDISIRTAVSLQQLTTQISVAHSDLGAAISAHIPSVQEKLNNEFGLHASIEVSHGGTDLSGERQQSSQNPKTFTSSPVLAGESMPADSESFTIRAPAAVTGDDVRLDIRA